MDMSPIIGVVNMSYAYHLPWLQKIADTIKKSLNEYPRTVMLRVDLRFPDIPSKDDDAAISRFIDSIKARIKANQRKKKKQGKRVHETKLRYVWVKEYGKAKNKKHYHVILILNKDAWCYLGEYKSKSSLSGIIMRAWCSALKLNDSQYLSLTHFPDNAMHWIHKNRPNEFTQAMSRAIYLAKYHTKSIGDNERNFGCSQQ